MVKNAILSAGLLALIAVPASADTAFTPGQIGLVGSEPQTVTLNVAKRGFEAGGECTLHPGDTWQVIGVLADGFVLGERKLHIRMAQPDPLTCPTGAKIKLAPAVAAAGIAAEVAAVAAKANKNVAKLN